MNQQEQLGYFSPASILVMAGVLSREDEFANLQGNEKDWIRWYSAFDELEKAQVLKASFTGGLGITLVQMEQYGLQVADELQRPFWKKAVGVLVGDVRTIVISVVSSVLAAILTIVVMRLWGFV